MKKTKSGRSLGKIRLEIISRAVDIAERIAAPYPVPEYEDVLEEIINREVQRLERDLMDDEELAAYHIRNEHVSALRSASTTDGIFRIEE